MPDLDTQAPVAGEVLRQPPRQIVTPGQGRERAPQHSDQRQHPGDRRDTDAAGDPHADEGNRTGDQGDGCCVHAVGDTEREARDHHGDCDPGAAGLAPHHQRDREGQAGEERQSGREGVEVAFGTIAHAHEAEEIAAGDAFDGQQHEQRRPGGEKAAHDPRRVRHSFDPAHEQRDHGNGREGLCPVHDRQRRRPGEGRERPGGEDCKYDHRRRRARRRQSRAAQVGLREHQDGAQRKQHHRGVLDPGHERHEHKGQPPHHERHTAEKMVWICSAAMAVS